MAVGNGGVENAGGRLEREMESRLCSTLSRHGGTVVGFW